MPVYQTRLQARLQRAQDPEEVPQTHSSLTSAPAVFSTTGVQPMMEAPPRQFLSAIGLQSCFSTAMCYPSESSIVGRHSQSSVTDTGPAEPSTTNLAPPRHFLSAIGLQSCSTTATCYPTESSSTDLQLQSSVKERPAEPSTTDLPSDSEGLRIPRIEQFLQSPSAGRIEARELEKGGANGGASQGPMMKPSPKHFISVIGLQSCSSTDTCYPTESSTVDLHSQSSATGRPAEPSTTDIPPDTWNYTIEGLRIPRIEQFIQSPSAGCHGAGGLDEWDATQKPVIEVSRAARYSSTHHSSADVKALEQCIVKVPTSEPSPQCSSPGYFITKPALREIATEVPSADATKPEEGPSTSQPLRKRVREQDDSVLPMPPKKRYLINTHDGPSVKCVQTGIKRKANDEAPSEELTNVANRRSSRKIKMPRRMDL